MLKAQDQVAEMVGDGREIPSQLTHLPKALQMLYEVTRGTGELAMQAGRQDQAL
jgi:hypothetical protein